MSGPFLPDRWKELAPLLDAVLEREPHDRPAFLDRACAGDTALRTELELLLAECSRSDRLFENGAVEWFAALLAESPRRLPDLLAGRYRVDREIGAGGMAIVYVARDLKHDREVALKVLRADLSAVIGAERFLEEVRITAKLDHPHILTLIDSGEADGFLFYVLPYVRGESLRAKLAREGQLSIEDALSITRQVASALDYAHQQGVVHRDIKPENILLHEGEAALADFGIALAVTEAGGHRLTETGISLGTPQYMSPEQATGDRALDGRSDIYSLATLLYEMLAGEPPVTGSTAQAILAKLLTERPTKLRVLRDTVPDGVEHAVEKALSKAPADRFSTAGAFARALDAAVASSAAVAPRRLSTGAILAVLGIAAIVVLAALLMRGKIGGLRRLGATLRDRTQITFTGHVTIPAISADGRTLAYRTTNCRPTGCTFGIALQDVGGAGTRQLFDGASAINQIEWSPDGRNLLLNATINPFHGAYLLSTLSGTPRLVAYEATFFAGGDSLLTQTALEADSKRDIWVRVSGLDGVAHDSIRVADAGDWWMFSKALPGSNRIVVGVQHQSRLVLRVIERDGRVRSRNTLGRERPHGAVGASADAFWISLGEPGTSRHYSVVRIPFDATSGRLSSTADTLYTGAHTGFSVTADGRILVLDEGSIELGLWGLDVSEAVRGVFPEQKRLGRSTSALNVRLSPDGKRVLIGRDAGAAGAFRRWSTIPFSGGADTPLALAGETMDAVWSDSATVATRERTPTGGRFALVDVRTGAVREPFVAQDSALRDSRSYSNVPGGGWAWVGQGGGDVRVQLPGEASPRRIVLPAWYMSAIAVEASRGGRHVAFGGWQAPIAESLGVSVISLADGAVTPWLTTFGEAGDLHRLKDGTFLLLLRDTPGTYSLHHLLGPGRSEKLGTIPRTVSSLSVSEDLKRAAVVVRDYHGDAWMSRVVRP
jgi:hypothetical protein